MYAVQRSSSTQNLRIYLLTWLCANKYQCFCLYKEKFKEDRFHVNHTGYKLPTFNWSCKQLKHSVIRSIQSELFWKAADTKFSSILKFGTIFSCRTTLCKVFYTRKKEGRKISKIILSISNSNLENEGCSVLEHIQFNSYPFFLRIYWP